MDPKLQEALKKVARLARTLGVPSFLLGVINTVKVQGEPRSEIVIHREHLTTKAALMIAIQSVHTVVEMELDNPAISKEEMRVLKGFKDDMNALVKATDKALVAAQEKRVKSK